MARIAGFHPAGPGSTPGVGILLLYILYNFSMFSKVIKITFFFIFECFKMFFILIKHEPKKHQMYSQRFGLTIRPPWRNWLARSAVNRKVGGSSPPGGAILLKSYSFKIMWGKF